ncbi:MAG TPA: FAD:protein FMN transferase, partial [Methylibium sp.]|uniref:FAD:protein FMN transferase n=1 Tax=Methylibium sp. TaxID=2067992 RepID=UPI002DB81551
DLAPGCAANIAPRWGRTPALRGPHRAGLRETPVLQALARAANAIKRPAQAVPRSRSSDGWIAREDVAMGTSIKVELWAEDPHVAKAAVADVMAEMRRIDATYSPHKADSELSRINRDAAAGPVAISDETLQLLKHALAFSLLSDGAFDISFASVGQHYDYRAGIAPDAATVERARASVGYRQLHVDDEVHTVRFGLPGMRIDLGGFAKGHAVDNAARLLRERGIAHAMVAAGGDSRVIGDRRGRPWSIGVRDPRRAGQMVAVLPLEDCAISTSGDYERCFERDGVRHHHLIDPATGRSAAGARSVTVLADDGLTAEALGKSLFVLGVERGLALVESLPGVDAVVVDAHGALHFSSGLLDRGPGAGAGGPPAPA